MVLVPIVVKNQDELEKASKLKRDVIIVKNQELFEAIQKQKKKLNRKKVGNNLGIIGGIITVSYTHLTLPTNSRV